MFGKLGKRPRRTPAAVAPRGNMRRREPSLEQLEDRCLLTGVPVDTSLSAEQGDVLIAALDHLVATADALDSYDALAETLPLGLGSLGERLDMGQILAGRVRDRVANYLQTDVTRTATELVAALESSGGTIGGVSVVVDAAATLGGLVQSDTENELRFDVRFVATRTSPTVSLDLGTAADELGLAFGANANVAVTSTLTIDFSFGVDLSENATADTAPFIRMREWSAAVDAGLTNPSSVASVGLLGLNATGSLDVSATVDIALANLDGDAADNLTAIELAATSIGELAVMDATGALSGSWQFAVAPGIGGFNLGSTPTVSLVSANPWTTPQVDLTTNSDFNVLTRFNRFDAAEIVGLLDELRDAWGALGESAAFDASLPFLDDTTLSQAFDLGEVIDRTIVAAATTGTGAPDFASLQQLVTRFATLLGTGGASYDVASHALTFDFDFSTALPAVHLPVGTSASYGALAPLISSGLLNVVPQTTSSFVLGIDLADRTIAASTPLAELNAGGGVAIGVGVRAANAAPVDGRLLADVDFTLNLGGVGAVNVHVYHEATSSNSTAEELAGDIGAAITAALVSAGHAPVVIVSVENGRLTLRANDRAVRTIQISGAQSLGFAAVAAGNLADMQLHFRDGTSANVNLDGATTIADVIAAMQNAAPGKVAVELNAAEERLVVRDLTAGGAQFRIVAAEGSLATTSGVGLGIAGSDTDGDGQIVGARLAFDAAEKRLSLEDASVTGSWAVAGANIFGTGRLGFLDLDIAGLDANAQASVTLKDIATQTLGRTVTLAELNRTIVDDVASVANVAASASASFHVEADDNFVPLSPSAEPVVTLNWVSLESADPVVTFNADSTPLRRFEHVAYSNVTDVLNELVPVIAAVTPIAEFDPALSQVSQIGTTFAARTEAALETTVESVQDLRTALATAFAVPVTQVVVALQGTLLNISLDVTDNRTAGVLLNINLGTLAAAAGGVPNLAGITSLYQTGGASVPSTVNATLQLDFALDLANAAVPVPLLYDTTTLDFEAFSRRNGNLSFSGLLGAIPVTVSGGSRTLDGDGNPATTNDHAHFIADLVDQDAAPGDGRIALADAAASFVHSRTGRLTMQLPLDEAGTTNDLAVLSLTINDIGNLANVALAVSQNLAPIVNATDFDDLTPSVFHGLDVLLARLADTLAAGPFAADIPLGRDVLLNDAELILGELAAMRDRLAAEANSPIAAGSPAAGGSPASGANPLDVFAGNIQQAIFTALGSPAPVDRLLATLFDDTPPAGPDTVSSLNDVRVIPAVGTIPINAPQVAFEFVVARSGVQRIVSTAGVWNSGGFSIAFPAGSNVDVVYSYSFPVRLVVSRTAGVYFDTTNPGFSTGPLSFDIDIRIPDLAGVGSFNNATFQVNDEDADNNAGNNFVPGTRTPIDQDLDGVRGSYVDVSGTANVVIPGGIAALGCIVTPAACPIVYTLDGTGSLNLDLVGKWGNMPTIDLSLRSNFVFDEAGAVPPLAPPPSLGDELTMLELHDISVDADELFGFVHDIIDPLADAFQPVRRIFDILVGPLPVLESPMFNIGLLDILEFGGILRGDWDRLFSLIDGVLDLAYFFPVMQPDTTLELGSFRIDNPGVNFRTVRGVADIPFDRVDYTPPAEGSLRSQIIAGSAGITGELFFMALDSLGGTGIPLSIPLLDDEEVFFRLVTSLDPTDDVLYDLVRLDIGTFNLSTKEFNLPPVPTFIIPGVEIQLEIGDSGSLDIDFSQFADGPSFGARLDVGFDTFGLERYLDTGDTAEIMNGLYLDDHASDGSDLPEMWFDFGVGASLSPFGVLLFDPFIEGGVDGNMIGNLVDYDEDGITRKYEIDEATQKGSAFCMFDPVGSIDGYLALGMKIGLDFPKPIGFIGVEYRVDVLRRTISSFADSCDGGLILGEQDPVTGALVLNSGPRAQYRDGVEGTNTEDDISDSDGGETFNVRSGENGSIVVEFAGSVQTFTGVTSICADGGAGNDTITIAEDFGIPVEIWGGPGADTLFTASGGVLRGGTNHDTLSASGPWVQLFGDDGDDTLSGGEGADFIDGGDGENIIYGNANNDTLLGGSHGDEIYGGDGHDFIQGNSGSDLLQGDAGNDTILGLLGDDTLRGEAGDDTLEAGEGVDQLFGGEGDDSLRGGMHDDLLYGEAGTDGLFGDEGHDIVHGGDDADVLFGGEGNDTLVGGGGPDTLNGTGGDDLLHGDEVELADSAMLAGDWQDDELYGGSDHDTLFGGFGSDYLEGSLGNDWIYAGFTAAGDGNVSDANTLSGGNDNDYLYGDLGNDFIEGGDGNDTVYALAGMDQVYGGAGSDQLGGGSGADFLYGEEGSDKLSGDDGDDYLVPGAGFDNVLGGQGDDVVFHVAIGPVSLSSSAIGDDQTTNLTDVEHVRLEGTAANDVFAINAWTRSPVLIDAKGGIDRIESSGNVDFVLSDWNLTRSDGVVVGLNSFEQAALTGGTFGNRFELDRFTGTATIAGGDGLDRLFAEWEGNYTISNASVVRPVSGVVTISGIDEVEIHGGAAAEFITAADFDGRVVLYGRDGNDTLVGGNGDDLIDGGSGADSIVGNAGRDELRAGTGAGNILDGGADDDVLYGSNDGADVIRGAAGHDRIFAYAGNDVISGGPGDDMIDAGAGDDLVAGDGGADLIVGGSQHDTLYGHNHASVGDNTADDLAVDRIYGDFGTNAGEAGSGRDRLFGNGGNDLLFGEGDDDFIDAGGGASNVVDYGAGEGVVPSDFVSPTPTSPPTLGPVDVDLPAAATLPSGVDGLGRWTEWAFSASGGGVSGSLSRSIEPTVVTSGATTYVAWADDRNGNFEIFVARHNALGWTELAGSAHGTGISGTANTSRRPSMAIGADGQPVVAWTEFSANGTTSDIFARRFDPTANSGAGGWVAMGTSTSGGGISASGAADHARLVNTAAGVVVGYLDDAGAATNVFVRRFNGTSWPALGTGAASGDGISDSTIDVSDFTLATDGTNVAAAWTQPTIGTTQIYARQYSGSTWNALSGSAAGGGVSNTAGESRRASAAYFGGSFFIAWEQVVGANTEVYAARHQGGWQAAGIGANAGGGVSNSNGRATGPRLAAGNALQLIWIDDRIAGLDGNTSALYARRWNGTAFVEELAGDASGRGIHPQYAVPADVALAASGTGVVAVWSDRSSGTPQIYLRANNTAVGNVYYVNDAAQTDDFYTTAVGSDANSGLSPDQPKASIASVLATYDLGPGDMIIVDNGVYFGSASISAGDAGVLVQGNPDRPSRITGNISVTSANGVALRYMDASGILVTTSNDVLLADNAGRATIGVHVSGGSNVQIVHNYFGAGGNGVRLTGSTENVVVAHNRIDVLSTGLAIDSLAGVVTNATVRDNYIHGGQRGVDLIGNATGRIERNRISAGTTALAVNASYSGALDIANNELFGATTGVLYSAAAALRTNRIYDNSTGVVSSVASVGIAFGFALGSGTNDIFDNFTGVNLTGRMQAQRVRDNFTGVVGSGLLGPDSDFALANLIEANRTGADFDGTIQFNRFVRNETGIAGRAGQLIAHNTFVGNEDYGIRLFNDAGARIVHNSMHAATGDNISVDNVSPGAEIRNNVLWAEQGYDIYVHDLAQAGFFSDYNTLHTSGNGKLVYWTRPFTDLLDWQADVARYDLHSIGKTVVNPAWSEPRFVNVASGDLRVFDLIAGQRFSSPTIDAGDPLSDLALPVGLTNLLTNGGFDGGLTGWTRNTSASAGVGVAAPFDGAASFVAGADAGGFAQQTIDLLTAGFSAAALDSRDLAVSFGGRVRTANEAAADTMRIVLTFLDGSGVAIGSPIVVQATNTHDRWELAGGRAVLPALTRSIRFRFETDRNTGATNDGMLDQAFVYVRDEAIWPDMGAFGNTTQENATFSTAKLALRSPDLYVDWERDRPRRILWDSFNNDAEANVRIDLYQDGPDGPTLIANISPGTADDGEHLWIPFAHNGISYDTHGLRIHISFVGNAAAHDRSTEGFSVPEDGTTYYVNASADGITDAEHDYTTAVGSNRNTGKRPDAPKPNPVNVLRTYELTSGATLLVDPGTYSLFDTISLSGLVDRGLGLDRGFTIAGPAEEANGIVTFRPAVSGNANQTLIWMDDADLMTIRGFTLFGGRHGLLMTAGSTGLVAEDLRIVGSDQYGVRIEGGSAFTSLTDVTVENVTQFDGLSIVGGAGGALVSVSASRSRYGLFADGAAILNVIGGEFFDNDLAGIRQDGFVTTGTWADVAAYENQTGLDIAGQITVNSADVYDNSQTGIIAGRSALASIVNSDIHGNQRGVELQRGTLSSSRVYGNALEGVLANVAPVTLLGNTIYSNQYGLFAQAGIGTFTLTNNLFYDHALAAIRLIGAGPLNYEIVNNTVYEPVADGLRASNGAKGIHLRNNIVWTQTGYGLYIDPTSQQGFTSDYNLLRATGAAHVGYWQGARATLDDWRFATFADANSMGVDPLFVNPDGADNALGGANGADDNFHVQSTFGSYRAATGTFAPDPAQSPAIDRGSAADLPTNEPTPNGGYVNLGAYGNTSQASLSPTDYVLVLRPTLGEPLQQESVAEIRWRSAGFVGNVAIEYSTTGAAGSFSTLAANEVNDGSFSWAIVAASFPASNNYVVRVRSITEPGVIGSSDTFTVGTPIHLYYVNDNSLVGDEYASAIGNDANDGLSPATPKASIRAILEAYDLGPEDVILVDAGSYTLTTNIAIANADSGVTIQGPLNPANPATVNRANVANTAFAFQLQNADDVTISDLRITGAEDGIRVETGSTGFTLRRSVVYDNDSTGVWIFDAASTGATIEDSTFYGNAVVDASDQIYGVRSAAGNIALLRNRAYHTGGRDSYGMYVVTAASGVVIRDNEVFNNSVAGIYVEAQGFDVTGNIAHDNVSGIQLRDTNAATVSTSSGNTAYANDQEGFRYQSWGEHAGNAAHDNATGFRSVTGFLGSLRDSSAWRNGIGIDFDGGDLHSNAAYGNTSIGIAIRRTGTFAGNRAYSNGVGIQFSATGATSTLRNNLIYDNATVGLEFVGAQSGIGAGAVTVTNNTIAETAGADAIRARSASEQIVLKNNIVSVSGAGRSALNIDADSQQGFDSNYNLFQVTGGAQLAQWQVPMPSLADWRLQTGFDANSISGDPRFVDPDGSDGVVGYQACAGLMFEGFANTTLVGLPAVTAVDASVNFSAAASYRGLPDNAQSMRWSGQVYLPAAGNYQFFILSAGPQRLFVGDLVTPLVNDWAPPSSAERNGVYVAAGPGWVDILYELSDNGGTAQGRLQWIAPHTFGQKQFLAAGDLRWSGANESLGTDDDFHVASTAGSFHAGNWIADALDSPAIDSGDPTDAVMEDPPQGMPPGDPRAAQDGNRVNLGAYGNTGQASRSPVAALRVTSPNGFEKFRAGHVETIGWTGSGFAGPVTIEISNDDGASWSNIVAGTANDGTFAWTPTTYTLSGMIRVRADANPALVDTSDAAFTVGDATNVYYVNDVFDGTTVDQYATAAGSNTNTGTRPSDPMASLSALLAAYDLGPGDTVFVDVGTYLLTQTIELGPSHAGIAIVGPPLGHTATLNRGSTADGQIALRLANADDVTIRQLSITGAFRGISVESDSDGVVLERLHIWNNNDYGVYVSADSSGAVIRDSVLHGDGATAANDQRWNVWIAGGGATLDGNTLYHAPALANGFGAFVDTTGFVTLVDNTAHGNGVGFDITADGAIAASANVARENATGFRFDAQSAALPGDIQDNTAYDNGVGFEMNGFTRVRTSEAFDNTTGLSMDGNVAMIAEGMTLFGNMTAVELREGTLRDSRVYDNSGRGVWLPPTGSTRTVVENSIYSNGVGIYHEGIAGGVNLIGNNLIYDHADAGIVLFDATTQGGSSTLLRNNTVYEPAADGVRLTGATSNVDVRNNIVVAGALGNFAMTVERGAQRNLVSDYNLFHAVDGARLGSWQTAFDTLLSWQLETGVDRHSLVGDPAFVDPLGADGALGAGGASLGADDNFALASSVGSYFGGGWSAQEFDSIAIDAGDPASAFAAELTPLGTLPVGVASQAGGRINLGANGGTGRASRSAVSVLQLLSMQGGEKVRVGRNVSITWRSVNASATVDVYWIDDAAGGVVTPIALGAANDGQLDWSPSVASAAARIRVVAMSAGGEQLVATSREPFMIGQAGTVYYVNDAFQAATDSYTNIAGSYLATGTTPSDPLPSIQAVLRSYGVGSGDTIRVDSGTYATVTNIVLGPTHSGLQIVGPTTGVAVLDRDNPTPLQNVLDILDADNVAVIGLQFTRGVRGVNVVDADSLVIAESRAMNNAEVGFAVDPTSQGVHFRGNTAFGTLGSAATEQDTGFLLDGSNMTIEQNTSYKVGGLLHRGFDVDASGTLVFRDNEAYMNQFGFVIRNQAGEVADNYAHDNFRGFEFDDYDAASATMAHGNRAINNSSHGFWVERNYVLHGNLAQGHDVGFHADEISSAIGTGAFLGTGYDAANVAIANQTGIVVQNGVALYNRVIGNAVDGIRATLNPVDIIGNIVYGNSVGIHASAQFRGTRVSNNLVYDNTNQAIYIHNSATSGSGTFGLRLYNNTLWHDVGTALWLANNGADVRLRNNVISIGAGSGIVVDGTTVGFSSERNNVFRTTGGANWGTWKGTAVATLAAWQVASGTDAASFSVNPLFVDIDGAENRLGWDRLDAASPFQDFGRDDNFLLAKFSPMIDAADSFEAPASDLFGRPRHDDPNIANVGTGATTIYDLGAFEFISASGDVLPPTVLNLSPMGLVNDATVSTLVDRISIAFSEAMDPIRATSAALYSLIEAGNDGAFDTADDVVVSPVAIEYAAGTSTATLVLSEPLAAGHYRLRAVGGPVVGVADAAGNLLDGDANGTVGGTFTRTFIVAEPASADFDNDGEVGATDIDLLMEARNSGAHEPAFDLNGDGTVDQDDVDYLVEVVLGTTYGDANLDGAVNQADVAILAGNFGSQSGAGWASGDGNGDGRVDLSDLIAMQINYEGSGPPSPVAAAADAVFAEQAREPRAKGKFEVSAIPRRELPEGVTRSRALKASEHGANLQRGERRRIGRMANANGVDAVVLAADAITNGEARRRLRVRD
jgi:Ca2+-binding RTX toxin-like protein